MRDRNDRQRPEQRSYLLRLWRTSEIGPLRATLIAIGAQAPPQHFADLDTLLEFLQTEPKPAHVQPNAHSYCTPDAREWKHPDELQSGGDANTR